MGDFAGIRWWFFLVLLQSGLTGCSLLEIKQQVETMESAGRISGRVEVASLEEGPVIVRRYFLKGNTFVSDSYTHASEGGEFKFDVLPGVYYVAAFVDRHRDGQYQKDKDGNYYQGRTGKPLAVHVGPGENIELGVLRVSGKPPQLRGYSVKTLPVKILDNIGMLKSLNDPAFSRENSDIGMWEPLRFLDEVGGGVFLLEEYRHDKIPVLFVHGLNGTPLDWKTVIGTLDRARLQPWVIYYPSGFRIDMISDYLAKALAVLHERYRFQEIIIVAHSMGGWCPVPPSGKPWSGFHEQQRRSACWSPSIPPWEGWKVPPAGSRTLLSCYPYGEIWTLTVLSWSR